MSSESSDDSQEEEVGPRRLPTKDYHPEKEVACVIVTIKSDHSYDNLFREVEQEGPTTESCVSLFEVGYSDIENIQKELLRKDKKSSDSNNVIEEIVRDVRRVDPDAVLFNFECCSGCGDHDFPVRNVPAFARAMLDRGYMVQFGDFSVKSLLREWDEALLGPNPFFRVDGFESSFTLRFDPKVLVASPSAQLEMVGELCGKGEARVSAMSDTIGFSIDWEKADTDAYELKVLSIITEKDGHPVENHECSIGAYSGEAGHVMLEYPIKTDDVGSGDDAEDDEEFPSRGGVLMLSAGHWIEMTRINTSVEEVARCAEENYGGAFATKFQTEVMDCANDEERDSKIQSYAQTMVQSRPCCGYSSATLPTRTSRKRGNSKPNKSKTMN